jgi:hypothetical protein
MGGMGGGIMIILHLDRTIGGVLGICRHAMVRNMGPVVKLCGCLHLDRLHEENKKKKNLITRIDALFTKGGECVL